MEPSRSEKVDTCSPRMNAEYFASSDLGEISKGRDAVAGGMMQALQSYGGDGAFKHPLVTVSSVSVRANEEAPQRGVRARELCGGLEESLRSRGHRQEAAKIELLVLQSP